MPWAQSGVSIWPGPSSGGGQSISVKDYGAVGDGTTDDTAAIQAAIDAVKGSQHVPPFNHTGAVFVPAGTYLLGTPVNFYSGLILRGVGGASLLKASGAFSGTRLVTLATTGTHHSGSVIEDLGFESAAGSGIAALQIDAATTFVTNCRFARLWLRTAHGLILNNYTQDTVLEDIVSHGAPDKLIHLKGNFNIIRNICKEGDSGTSTDPYIWVEAHAAGDSVGNLFENILLESTGSVNKSGITLSGVDQTILRNFWWEATASDGYALRITGSKLVTLEGFLRGILSDRKIKVETTRLVHMHELNTDLASGPLSDYLEVDAASCVSIGRVQSRTGADLLRLDRRVTVGEHYTRAIQSDALVGYVPTQTPRYLTAQNLLINPSFEAGRYGWTFTTVPATTEAYIQSEVGQGLMGHFVWTGAAATHRLRQSITVPTEWVGFSLTLSFLAKLVGTGSAYLTPHISGAGITDAVSYSRCQAGSGWCFVSLTVVPQSAGALLVGISFAAIDSTYDAYVDEAHLAFGTVGVPNPAKWASYELNGKTHTNAAAIPTTGTWKVGDIVWNSGAGTSGWKCTAAGTPGTWEELASAPAYPLRAPDGLVTAPSYSFASDTASGMFWLSGSPILADNSTRIASWSGTGFNIDKGILTVRDLAGATLGFILIPEANHVMAQRSTTSGQTYRLYGTWTDASNYERLALSHTTGTGATLAVETAGTGGDNLDLALTPAGTGRVRINTALNTAVGGGATAAFTAAMVGSAGGPTTAAQNGWLMLKDSTGAAIWVPVWK